MLIGLTWPVLIPLCSGAAYFCAVCCQHLILLIQPAVHAGAISETEVVVQFVTLLAAGLGVAYGLDRFRGRFSV